MPRIVHHLSHRWAVLTGEGIEWTPKMRDRQKLHRASLLRFLQASVATWCRPDAAHDLSTDPKRNQWLSNARVVQLNPKGRRQTKKYRPAIPVPRHSPCCSTARPRATSSA